MNGGIPIRCAEKPRCGYTLLEMLMVLSVLVVMTAIVFPPLNRMYADHFLKRSVEEVRVKLTSTRIHALDSGVTYQFRFEPEGQHYLMIPYESDVLAAPDASSGDSATTLGGASFKYAGKLPEDIRFAFEEDVDGTAERLPDELLDGLPDAHDLKDAAWSPPLLFYPDGTAIDATFRAIDSKSQLVRLSVRGLTGAVTVSSVEMEDER